MTPNPDFKGRPLFDVEYLENRAIITMQYYAIYQMVLFQCP